MIRPFDTFEAYTRHAIVLLALVSACPTAASGSALEASDFRGMSLEELMEVRVVSATRQDEAVLDVPSSVTVFTRAQIEAIGARELTDLVNHVPGWQSYSSDSWGTDPVFSSRGRRLAYSARDILILIDGTRVNREWSGGGSTMWPHLSLAAAQRVEFIRGPGSAIYGSNAFLGVVNVVTAVDDAQVLVSATSTDALRVESRGRWNAGPIDGSSTISWVRDDGDELENVYDNVSRSMTDARDAFESLDVFQRLAWGPLRLDLAGAMNWSRDYYFAGRFSDTGRGRTTRGLATLHASRNFNASWSGEARFGLSFAREELDGPFTAPGDIAPVTFPSSDARVTGDADQQELEPHFLLETRFAPTDRHDLLFGYEWRRPVETATRVVYNIDYGSLLDGNFPIAPPDGTGFPLSLAPNAHREIHGAYAQWKWGLFDRATLTLGGRFDAVEDLDEAFSPRAALVVRPDDGTAIKLMYGQAFRAPTIHEMFIENNPLYAGNPDLRSETARTTEIGLVRRIGPTLTSATWFWTTIEDAIVQTALGDRIQAANGAGTEVYQGLELEARADLATNVSALLTLAHLFDRPTSSASEARTVGGLTLTVARGAWSGALSGYVHSSRSYRAEAFDQTVELDPRAELRLHQSWRMSSGVSLFADVDNVLDDDQRTPSGATNNPFGTPVRGRRLELGLRIDLDPTH